MTSLVKRRVDCGGKTVVLLDSIMMIDEADAGSIVVSSSHGGVPAAIYALKVPIAAAFFNDAGVGKDNAGIGGLPFLDARNLPAGAVAHTSARIGDVEDMWANGILSHVNATAAVLGMQPGMTLPAAAALMASGSG